MMWIILSVISIFFLVLVLDWLVLGFAKPIRRLLRKGEKKSFAKGYILETPNYMAYQKTTECSGFATAHVFRSFGMETEGSQIYESIQHKMKNGAVMPKTLKKFIRKSDMEADYVKGSLESLKTDLSEGKRIIVFIKTRLDKNWLHYVSVVGYDENNVFIAESMSSLKNCETKYYNRKVTNEEFMKYWDTREWYMPFYKNTYLMISKKS